MQSVTKKEKRKKERKNNKYKEIGKKEVERTSDKNSSKGVTCQKDIDVFNTSKLVMSVHSFRSPGMVLFPRMSLDYVFYMVINVWSAHYSFLWLY